jgi:hypothetical protein
MRIALKCFNRLYIKPNSLKDSFTWIYVFPNEINPAFFEHYLAYDKNPTSLKKCLQISTTHLTEREIEKWNSILIYTKNVGSYYNEFPTNHNDYIHKQYMIRDYTIKLE